MAKPLLIIVTGPPASGKTTIARTIASRLEIPVFHKDEIKERLALRVPGAGLRWSKQLGAAGYDVLFYTAEVILGQRGSCILEANFHPELSLPSLADLAERSTVVQIVCAGSADQLLSRYLKRHASGKRHPVHLDIDERRLRALAKDFRIDHCLDLPGLVFRHDTTSGMPLDLDEFEKEIRKLQG